MSLFPRAYISQEPSFTPLFRLLDEFDTHYSRGNAGSHGTSMKSFNPKFDVKENDTAYELHGELPGIEQKDVEIEFTDAQTLSIRGRTERSYESGSRSSGFIEGPSSAGAITESGESNGNSKTTAHQPTVEDEDTASSSTAPASTEVAKKEPAKDESGKDEPAKTEQPASKFWVSERSIGEFSRAFSFPVRVDQDAVKASMKNGILSIVVPKAKKLESRKITIS